MAFTLSRYLRLRLDSNLTANARYNLDRLDELGSTFVVDTVSNLNIRSESDIVIEPQSADVGGTGVGGSVSLGTSNHSIDSFQVYASNITFSNSPGILDQAPSGSKYLRLKYNSALNGAVDTAADRTLSLDLDGADRNLILGGDLSLLGGNLSITVPTSSVYTYPSGYGLPGQVWAGDGAGAWSWVTVGGSGGSGDVSGYSTTWGNGDGTTKVITHGLLSNDVEVAVLDESDELMLVDSVSVTSSNSITLVASEAPTSSWRIVVQAK